ncbi:UNVERIFIED_CONTAM: hypothetical protein HDU68_007090 [Siphonaria sp. JEL0065]|nr:hypothetical protein HDU68_007090 [Siphonaria sp. JEL0065]
MQLFKSVKQLQPSQYKAHAGLAFRSVHGTLCHLLQADRIWTSTLRLDFTEINELGPMWHRDDLYAGPDDSSSYWEDVVPDFETLEALLLAQADTLIQTVSNLSEDQISGTLMYPTTSGASFAVPFSKAILHAVNHATHHRGQVSAALIKMGLAPPVMDYMYYGRK